MSTAHEQQIFDNQPEILDDHNDYLKDYGDVRVNFFGVEGTIDELVKICPFADKIQNGEMDVADVNDYVIRMMNGSGAEVKEEHAIHFTERLTDMGREIKFVTRKEERNQPDENIKEDDNKSHKPDNHKHNEVKQGKVKETFSEPDVKLGQGPASTHKPRVERDPDPVKRKEDDNANTEFTQAKKPLEDVTIYEWMDVIEAEFTERFARDSELVKKNDPVFQEPELLSDPKIGTPNTRLKSSSIVGASESQPTIMKKEPVKHEVSSVESAIDVRLTAEIKVGDVVTGTSESGAGIELDDDSAVESAELVPAEKQGVSLGVDKAKELKEEELIIVEELAIDYRMGAPDVLVDIFEADSALSLEEANHEDGAEKTGVVDDIEFITQIEEFLLRIEESSALEGEVVTEKGVETTQGITEVLETSEASEVAESHELPRQAFIEVLNTSCQIRALEAKIEAFTEDSQDKDMPQEIAVLIKEKEELQEKLYEICEQFLGNIGVEPSEEKVQALVDRVLKIDFETLEEDYSFTPQQLSNLGTHEYKLSDWFSQKTSQVISGAEFSFHQIVGFLAIKGRGLHAEEALELV